MSEKTLKMIRIKWVRSGIGFTYHQKTIVRSLGLNKLNHTVVRPDTPQIRGIVAAIPHMLEIVPEPVASAWASIPEYTVSRSAGDCTLRIRRWSSRRHRAETRPVPEVVEEDASHHQPTSAREAAKKKESTPKESEPA